MRSDPKRWCVVIAAVSIVAGLMAGSASKVRADDPNPGVIPPVARGYGMTYGEWSARWWQWALSLPADQNPFFDGASPGNTGCANGANGQLGPVWFLTGVVNESGTAVRDCTVRPGKALFFPIINVECSTLEAEPFHLDTANPGACLGPFHFDGVFAEVDGVAVQVLDDYLVDSPVFTFTVPPNNVLGVDPNTGRSASRGYYLMLAPLPVGEHVIHFGGTYAEFGFTLDITYNLTVSPAVLPRSPGKSVQASALPGAED